MTASAEVPTCGACPGPARHVCSRCHLQRYCSRECQTGDWSKHRAACKSVKAPAKKVVEALPEATKTPEGALCALCHAPATTKCSSCHKVHYCKRMCQREHWAVHRADCHPFEVLENEELGRYLSATKEIKAGDVIIKEEPLMLSLWEAKTLVCVVCFTPVDDSIRCEDCAWPVCGARCRGSVAHVSECLLSRGCKDVTRGLGPEALGAVLHLRMFALQDDKEKFQKFMSLRFHDEERKKNKTKADEQNKIINLFKKKLKLSPKVKENQLKLDEVVKHSLARFDENALEVDSICSVDTVVKGLYPTAALMEHCCQPNTRTKFTSSNSLVLKAAVDIKVGAHISTSYTKLLQGTKTRRHGLEKDRYFLCTCPRCEDPSECATNFSALKCKKCTEGYLQPKSSLDPTSVWICDKCDNEITSKEADSITANIEKDVNKAMESPEKEKLEDLLKSHVAITVHANHYHLLLARHTLLQLYGGGETAHKEDTLSKKETLCQDLMSLFSRVDPGGSRVGPYAGVVLYEYHILVMVRVQKLSNLEYPNEKKIDQCIAFAKALLRQCINTLKDDPETSPEGKLKTIAAKKLTEIGLLTAKPLPAAPK